MRVKVYKIELCVIDFEALGESETKEIIESQKYPNYCIAPRVKAIESREVEWSDEHPLNKKATADQEYHRLFAANQ